MIGWVEPDLATPLPSLLWWRNTCRARLTPPAPPCLHRVLRLRQGLPRNRPPLQHPGLLSRDRTSSKAKLNRIYEGNNLGFCINHCYSETCSASSGPPRLLWHLSRFSDFVWWTRGYDSLGIHPWRKILNKHYSSCTWYLKNRNQLRIRTPARGK